MADHAVATRLIIRVYHVNTTPFVARLAYLWFRHRNCQFCDDMIISRNVVEQEIKVLGGLNLSSENNTVILSKHTTRSYIR